MRTAHCVLLALTVLLFIALGAFSSLIRPGSLISRWSGRAALSLALLSLGSMLGLPGLTAFNFLLTAGLGLPGWGAVMALGMM